MQLRTNAGKEVGQGMFKHVSRIGIGGQLIHGGSSQRQREVDGLRMRQ